MTATTGPRIFDSILHAIGDTPMVRLNKVVPAGSAEVLVKCEYLNPAGSIKDRMAYYIIEDAEARGLLKPGGVIVENTSGNTGLGLAMVAAVKGYRCIFTMPDKMSLEKVNMLKGFGAEVVITPTNVPADSPDNYVETAKRIARETPGGFYVNQYHNPMNGMAHEALTGPEIWRDTGGRIDAFVAGLGTGGTISGVGRYLRRMQADSAAGRARIIGVDPIGSINYHYFYTKTLSTPHVYKVEGIGEDMVCGATDFAVIDEVRQITDTQAFRMARRLVREEGIFCGGSSGAHVHVACEVARELGPGKVVVVVLSDSGSRYISKFLSDAWMKDYGFLEETPELGYLSDMLARRKAPVITARASETLSIAIQRMKQHQVSQLPVVDDTGAPVGIVAELDILRALQSGTMSEGAFIKSIMQPVAGLMIPKTRIEELYKTFESGHVAIVVDNGKVVGIVSQIDLIEYLAQRSSHHTVNRSNP